MTSSLFHAGSYTAAKADYLDAAMDEIDGEIRPGHIAVNIKWARPMHPHGMRMVRDGLMTVGRSTTTGRKSSAKSYTILKITAEGQAELARLQKVAARKARKRGPDTSLPDKPGSRRKSPKPRDTSTPAERLARRTAAIAFLKKANEMACAR
jgi:hypothetical protein